MTRRNLVGASDRPSRVRLSHKGALASGFLMGVLFLFGCQEDELIRAARTKDLATVKILVESGGANVDIQDETGHTPLMAAASHSGLSVVNYLVGKGAKVDLPNKEGWTPLAYAVTIHELDLAKLLLDKGADANARFSHFQDGKRTILMQTVASTEGDDAKDKGFRTIQLLLERGVQVDAQDDRGETALMYAVRAGKPGIVKLFLSNKADASLRNKKNQTALDIARAQDQKKVVEVLGNASAPKTR